MHVIVIIVREHSRKKEREREGMKARESGRESGRERGERETQEIEVYEIVIKGNVLKEVE